MSEQTGNHEPSTTSGPASLSDRVRSLRLAGQINAGRGKRSWLPWAICAVFFLSTVVLAFRSMGAPAQAKKGSDADSPTAESKDVALESKGNIIPSHLIQLSPQVGGEIVWLDPDFKEGAVYGQNAKLAEVDPVIYRAQLASAKAALAIAETNRDMVESGSALREIESAKLNLKSLEARLDLAKIDERNKRRAGAATPRDELEKAVVQLEVDQAALDNQKKVVEKLTVALEEQKKVTAAQVQKAKADVAQAEKQLANCTIKAPVDGIILTKKAELRGYVNPFAFGAAGYLCEMADLTQLEVELFVQERDIREVKVGQLCRIVPDAFKDKKYHGFVSRMMPTADRSKGAIPVRVVLARLELTDESLKKLGELKEDPLPLPDDVLGRLAPLKGRECPSETAFVTELKSKLGDKDAAKYKTAIVKYALTSSIPREEEGAFLKPDMSVIVSFLK